MKKGEKNYQAYKIVSFASISNSYLKQELSLLTKAINSGSSNREVYASLEKIRNKIYLKNQKIAYRDKKSIEELIKILKFWFL